jgi:uncharacterized protein with von Willebrand factor type A (vWA) domain
MPDDYKVGYKQPPKTAQFQKGKSGNPRGRPKNARNLKTDLAEELAKRIAITVQGRTMTVSKQRAVLMALTAKAIKGDPRAAVVILNMINQLFGSDTELNGESSRLSSTDEEIIDAFLQGQLQAPATGEME